jgi:hypothetical protein
MALTTCRECQKEVSTEAATCPNCGTPKPANRPGAVPRWAKILGAIVVVVLIGKAVTGSPNPDASQTSVASVESSPAPPVRTDPVSQAKLKYTWNKTADDLVMSIDFTVRNPTDEAFKDFEITCVGYAPSGTEIDRNERTVYQTVRAHGSRTMTAFNMGFLHTQVSSESCSITKLVPAP